MNIRSFFKRLLLVAMAIAPAAFITAVPIKHATYRKKIGNKTIYRICIGDFHKDYADGRGRKKHHAQLMRMARILQQQGKTVHFIVEDMTNYTGPNPAIAQEIRIINQEVLNQENYLKHAQPTAIDRGGLVTFITNVCNQHGISCQNIELRHAQNVRGPSYIPSYRTVFDNVFNDGALLINNSWFQAEFPQFKGFIDIFNQEREKISGASLDPYPTKENCPSQEAEMVHAIEVISRRLLDINIIHALHQQDIAQTDYVFVVTGGLHLDYLNGKDVRYWDKFGYELVHSVEIPARSNRADLDDSAIATIVAQGAQMNLEQEIMPHLGLPNAPTQATDHKNNNNRVKQGRAVRGKRKATNKRTRKTAVKATARKVMRRAKASGKKRPVKRGNKRMAIKASKT